MRCEPAPVIDSNIELYLVIIVKGSLPVVMAWYCCAVYVMENTESWWHNYCACWQASISFPSTYPRSNWHKSIPIMVIIACSRWEVTIGILLSSIFILPFFYRPSRHSSFWMMTVMSRSTNPQFMLNTACWFGMWHDDMEDMKLPCTIVNNAHIKYRFLCKYIFVNILIRNALMASADWKPIKLNAVIKTNGEAESAKSKTVCGSMGQCEWVFLCVMPTFIEQSDSWWCWRWWRWWTTHSRKVRLW